MKPINRLLSLIASFFAVMFGRTASATTTNAPSTAKAAVESAVRRPMLTDKHRRRLELHQILHRIDGGGKHYGSKRAAGKNRKYGKRSGRQ